MKAMRARLFAFPSLVLLIWLLTTLLGLDLRQVAALTVFLGFVYGTLLFWKFRLAFALLGIMILLVLGLIDVPTLLEHAGLDIILFLMGTMIVIGFLEERRFFEYLIERIIVLVGPRGYRLIAVFMIMSALFSALIGEVTSILFMAAAMIHLAIRVKLNPVPFVILSVFATNIGSAATVVGNPVGVMIALQAGQTFESFIRWASPISILALLVAIPVSMLYYRADVRMLDERLKLHFSKGEEESSDIFGASNKELIVSALVFIGTITALILHHQVEEAFGLESNSMLIGTALGAASIVLLIDKDKARELVERRVDWWTLSFFMLLFASVGTLSYIGVTQRIANVLIGLPLDDAGLFVVFTWVVGLLSAFMDNVLAVATFIPIVEELSRLGVNNFPFWWGALFAGTFFGNLTIIGSTANIVAIGMMERRKLGVITMGEWIKPGLIVSVITLFLATIMVLIQVPFMPST